MIKRYRITQLMLISILIGLAFLPTLAADPSVVVKEEEITLQKIKGYFDAAFLKAEFDKDGDLKIIDGGFKVFVKIDNEKKLISYFSLWGLKASVPEIKKLQLINTMNNDLIFVRFSMPRATTLLCDYQFLYEGGITPYSIITNYRTFARVSKGGIETKDPDNIIGSE